jgi:7-carboxy-7-deazaguanine synthase
MATAPLFTTTIHDDPRTAQFNVSEIFHSIQGEGTRAGLPCTFVRLQGCTLRCSWCDTPYALEHRTSERVMTGQDILDAVHAIGCTFIEFTGGEPLEQPAIVPLMQILCDEGYDVAVETGGHCDISVLDSRVIAIVDVKCPGSKMDRLNDLANLTRLRPHDEVKFVLASRHDYEFARDLIQEHRLETRSASVLMSCVPDRLPMAECVSWILADGLPVRFQVQMHKIVWSPETRGV